MENQQIICPHCSAQLSVMNEDTGKTLQCPMCKQIFRTAPVQGQYTPAANTPSQNAAGSTDIVNLFIPKNTPAIVAYYLGVFSVILSYFLGLPAIIFGITGIVKSKQLGGLGHAITGILLGLFGPLIIPLIVYLFCVFEK